MSAKEVRNKVEGHEAGAGDDIGHTAEKHFTAYEISAVRKELALRLVRIEQQVAEWKLNVEALRASAPPLRRAEAIVALDPASFIAFEAAHEIRCAMMLRVTESAALMQDHYPALEYRGADGVRRNQSADYRATFADGSQLAITPGNLIDSNHVVPPGARSERCN